MMLDIFAYEGTGTVTYQKDGVSASLSITVTQPCFGLYSSKEASAAAYLGSEIRIGSADDTFYIVEADGFENFEITEIHFDGTSGSHDASEILTSPIPTMAHTLRSRRRPMLCRWAAIILSFSRTANLAA